MSGGKWKVPWTRASMLQTRHLGTREGEGLASSLVGDKGAGCLVRMLVPSGVSSGRSKFLCPGLEGFPSLRAGSGQARANSRRGGPRGLSCTRQETTVRSVGALRRPLPGPAGEPPWDIIRGLVSLDSVGRGSAGRGKTRS